MAMSIQEEIELINDIIISAIYHGGDLGGAYYSDWLGLESAIGEWLNARGLSDLYTPYNDKIVSISKVSLCNLSSDEDIWYLRIPALDSKGKRIGAFQKWQEIQREGLQNLRPGVKFLLSCGRKEKLPFRFQQEEECVVAIDIAGAEADGICEFYQEKENSSIFVNSIPSKYLSLCRTKAMEVNVILAWSGYEVYYTKSDWSNIGIRNLTEGKYIELYADGHIKSLDSISSELMDSLHKAHDMYWKQG